MNPLFLKNALLGVWVSVFPVWGGMATGAESGPPAAPAAARVSDEPSSTPDVGPSAPVRQGPQPRVISAPRLDGVKGEGKGPTHSIAGEKRAPGKPDADPGDTGERSLSTDMDVAPDKKPANEAPATGKEEPAPASSKEAAVEAESPESDSSPVAIPEGESDESPAVEKPEPVRPPLDAHAQFLRERISRCLQFYFQRRNLDAKQVSAWSIMHAGLSFGVESRIHRDGPESPLVNALGWLCWNGVCRDRRMMEWKNRELVVLEGPGFQGHPGQFLAVLAQCKVGRDYPLHVDGQQLTVYDLVQREMATCRPDMELTFKLIGLSHYLPSDATWKDDTGGTWTIPRLMQIELAAPLNGVACGGTHRLMGISYSLRRRELRAEPIEGTWGEARQRVNQYIDRSYALQNPDGSFSSQWYQRKADWGDIDRKLQTTGHMLEWLVFSLPEEQLADPRAVRSVAYLTELMINNRFYDWENGPRGHALRALMTYADRRFGLQVQDTVPSMANQPTPREPR